MIIMDTELHLFLWEIKRRSITGWPWCNSTGSAWGGSSGRTWFDGAARSRCSPNSWGRAGLDPSEVCYDGLGLLAGSRLARGDSWGVTLSPPTAGSANSRPVWAQARLLSWVPLGRDPKYKKQVFDENLKREMKNN